MGLLNRINLALLLIYSLFLLALTAFKSASFFLPELSFIEISLGGDKREHFFLACVLSLLVWPVVWAFDLKSNQNKIKSTLFTFFLLVFALLVDEFHQVFIGARYFDWQDTLYGVSGLLFGLLIRVLLKIMALIK